VSCRSAICDRLGWTSDGSPWVYPQGFKEIYRVYTQDGSSTLASGDHLWSVYTRADRHRGKPARVLQTKEMVGNLRAAHYHRYELPLLSEPVASSPGQCPSIHMPSACYWVTVFLVRATPTFATADPELADVLNRITTPGEVITIENPVTGAMRRLGLAGAKSNTKFVPDDYLFNSPDVRLAVLQGVFDSDGGPVTQQGGPAVFGSQPFPIDCAMASLSSCSRSAVSCIAEPGKQRPETWTARGERYIIAPTHTSSTSACLRALLHFGWLARPRSTTP